MAIQELNKKEIDVVSGGLVLPKLHLGTVLKGLINTAGKLLKKFGL